MREANASFSNCRQTVNANLVKTEVNLQMNSTSKNLHTVWEKSLLHCWNLSQLIHPSICLTAKQCQPISTDFIIQKTFSTAVSVTRYGKRGRPAAGDKVPYVTKTISETLSISCIVDCIYFII